MDETRDFLHLSGASLPALQPAQRLLLLIPAAVFPGLKRPGHEAGH